MLSGFKQSITLEYVLAKRGNVKVAVMADRVNQHKVRVNLCQPLKSVFSFTPKRINHMAIVKLS